LRVVVARPGDPAAVKRVAAPGEWRTNVALGARREPTHPSAAACAIAIAAAHAIGGDLVGVDLLPADVGTWVVLEVIGAVDINSTYTLDEDAHHAARLALTARLPSVRVEPAA
jgi:glutathione synthase/RimK-type ligase-like ATP-grasp enzyme